MREAAFNITYVQYIRSLFKQIEAHDVLYERVKYEDISYY